MRSLTMRKYLSYLINILSCLQTLILVTGVFNNFALKEIYLYVRFMGFM